MSRLSRGCLILLFALAGCSSSPRGQLTLPPDWNSSGTAMGEAEKVPPPPKFAPPPAPPIERQPTNTTEGTWVPLSRWSRETHSVALRRIAAASSPTFALESGADVLVVQPGNLSAKWDGAEIYFGFKPQLIDGQPFVHTLDLKKNIQPLFRGLDVLAKTNCVIVIDPGHGGENTGTKSVLDGTLEKEFTLDWAKRLAALLATNGWQVFLTRTNDADVPNSNRVAFADEHKADLFVSLHFNAPSETQSGVETYCLTPAGMPSTLTRGYDDDTTIVYPNNSFDAENLELAVRLHRALLGVNGMIDRGVRRARFMTVLRGQNRPAVLIEGGFLSNPNEARRIAEPEYREKLAEALSAALIDRTNSAAPNDLVMTTNISMPALAAGQTSSQTRTNNQTAAP